MALVDLQKEARGLKLMWPEGTTEEELAELIKQEKEKRAKEEEEKKIAKENQVKADKNKKSFKLILKNIEGKDVREEDYFYPGKDKDGNTFYALPSFNQVCGLPVEREDMIEVFKKIFGQVAPEILFYKVKDKEIYIVIVPLSRASVVGEAEDSIGGDYQKHSMSFIGEGSVNLDTLKLKLKKIALFIKKSE